MATGPHIDFETASATDIKLGVHKYFECPTTRVWGFSYRVRPGEPIKQWRPGWPDPQDLLDAMLDGEFIVAHNATFERLAWRFTRERYGKLHWPQLTVRQQSCTMSRAAALALPQALDDLGRVLNFTQQKDDEGYRLMLKMAKPKVDKLYGTLKWLDDEASINRLMQYCDQDIRTEEEADMFLPPLTPYERELWILDQTINDRGVYIDLEAVTRAVDVVTLAKKAADKRMNALTEGAVKKCTELGKLVAWINARGIQCESVKKGNQDELLIMSDLVGDKAVREAIELRREAAKTSTSKYSKMLACVCNDGRLRGMLNYHGASTGRWAGRLVQPQNMPRVDPDTDGPMVEFTATTLALPMPVPEIYELIELGVDKPLPALSKTLRAMFRAEPGNKLVGGDFSNIEGRINAWLAGEQWKLDAFAQYDAGTGPDLYRLAYSKSFGEPVETVGKGHKRQIGKVQELALGYQGGVGAYLTMGDTYNVKAYDLVKPVKDITSAKDWDDMAIRFEKARDKKGLPEAQWTALKLIVAGWRAAHPNITQSWWDLGDAAVEAVDAPGTPVPVYSGRVMYVCVDGWLYCRLPSGRIIAYCDPHVETTIVTLVNKQGEEYEREKNTVYFYGKDSKTGQWVRRYLYGGLQCENIVQATARCMMDHAMFRIEAAGYPLILTVHDELLAEVAKSFGSAKHFESIMAVKPDWIAGCPITVSAWEDDRYVK